MTKLLVEKAQKHHEEQINAKRHKVEYAEGKMVLLNANKFTLRGDLIPKFMSKK
jgi:hypothetical protein